MKTEYELLKFSLTMRALPEGKRGQVTAFLELYEMLDEELSAFRSRSGLQCRSGCGNCCHRSTVATSVAEMMPMAVMCVEAGTHNQYVNQVDLEDESAPCVFFAGHLLGNGGHCQHYFWRPMICRLYGFSARRDKDGRHRLMMCDVIRSDNPQKTKAAEESVLQNGGAPVSADYRMKGIGIMPGVATELMNINLAFVKAVDIVLFYRHGLASCQSDTSPLLPEDGNRGVLTT